MEKLIIFTFGLVLAGMLMSSCDDGYYDMYCYYEGDRSYDEYCDYDCHDGYWHAKCKDKELERCLNRPEHDFYDCMYHHAGRRPDYRPEHRP